MEDVVFSIWSFEFGSCVPKCSDKDMDSELLRKLEVAYHIYPFVITSGFRSYAYERSRHRKGTSSHSHMEDGKPCSRAVDIRCRSSKERWLVINALLLAGFTRIGIAKDHIHTDIDVNETRPDKCIFLE